MASLLSAAQRRRLDQLTRDARGKVRDRERQRDKAEALATIRAACAAAGLDLEQIYGIRSLATAERELRERGDPPALQRADAAFIAYDPGVGSARDFALQFAPREPAFAGRPPPPYRASLADWYCWSLAAVSARQEPPAA